MNHSPTSRRLLTLTLGVVLGGLVLFAAAAPALAQTEGRTTSNGFVQCTSTLPTGEEATSGGAIGGSCDLCDLMQLINNVTFYAVSFVLSIATVMALVSGFLYVTAAGDEHRITQAKTSLKFAIVGFIFAMLAGIIVKTIIFSVFPGETPGWGTFACQTKQTGDAPTSPVPPVPPTNPPGGTPTGNKPSSLFTPDPTCDGNNQRRASSTYGENQDSPSLQSFNSCYLGAIPGLTKGVSWQGCHNVRSCHFGGTKCLDGSHAVDYPISGASLTQEKMNYYSSQAQACGGVVRFENQNGTKSFTSPNAAINHMHINVSTGPCGCN